MIEKMHQRYLTIGELFSFSWDFFRLNIRIFLIFAVAIGTPLFVFSTLLSFQWAPIDTVSFNQLLPKLLGPLSGMIVTAAASGIAYIGLSYKIERSIAGVQVSFTDSINYGIGRILPLIGTKALVALIYFAIFLLVLVAPFVIFEAGSNGDGNLMTGRYLSIVALLLLISIIPATLFHVYWAFIEQAVVLRQRSMIGALNYSKSLVKGRWWRVAGFLILIALTSGIVASGIERVAFISPDNLLLNYIASIVNYLNKLFFLVIGIVFFLNLDYLTYPTTSQQTAHSESVVASVAPDDPPATAPDIMSDDAWNKPTHP